MISAIVYTSNSGYTAEYARMLGELTGLPVNDLRQVHNPQPQREVIFLGWIMADNVMGYAKASRFYKVRAVCQVGMGPATQAASDKLRQKLKLGPEVQVFTLQGGFDIRRLHGPYKWIMQVKCRETVLLAGINVPASSRSTSRMERATLWVAFHVLLPSQSASSNSVFVENCT